MEPLNETPSLIITPTRVTSADGINYISAFTMRQLHHENSRTVGTLGLLEKLLFTTTCASVDTCEY